MKRLLFFVLMLTLGLSLSGCATRAIVGYGNGAHYQEDGPPPHAPAHGYRHKHHNHNLVYDSKLAAYVVVGYDDYFFIDDLYFRYRSGDWQFSASMNENDWHNADSYQVPIKLRNSKSAKHKKKDKNEQSNKHKNRDD